MNRDNESERDSQRTVADLLAQYGEGSGNAAPRRRRRRAEDANETAPQQIIDRINSDSGQLRALRDEQALVEEPPAAPPRAAGLDTPSRRDLPSYDTPSGRFARPATPTRPVPPPPPPPVADPAAAELTTEVPAITDAYPAIADPPVAPGTATSGRLPRPDAPPVPPKPAPRSKPRVQPDPVTEVLPVIADAPQADPDAPPREGEDWFTDTGYQERYVEDEAEHTTQYQALRASAPKADPETEDEDEQPRPARGPAGLDEDAEVPDDYDEDEDEEPRSPAKEWLMMVVQLGGGVIGGAGLWLGFQWLWRAIPSITLFLALAVIGGMVWLVRKIRKADDLQTILLAVLVGLVVTVSPAALLLVGK
ncbi:hypothetical protein [Crossiella sp. CA198]|uniref:hypothetical protein n=1 Tax=Crossiella sp. CA198 TaxID=3455607 RepID=UPI003F8CF8DB